MTYNFLVLDLIFLVPGIVVFALRKDLRPVIGWMALASLPFAFTEFLFYPDYWEPTFLFDLADKIGFGIEDFLFVVALAAFTSTSYAAFTGRRYESVGTLEWRGIGTRAGALLGATFLLVAAVALIGIPMIYGSLVIMVGVTSVAFIWRRDLAFPALMGGLLSSGVYTLLCLVFAWLLPQVFEMAWHTDKFLGIFVLGVPLEEVLYGFAAGFAATTFYPFVFRRRFVITSKA